MEATSQSPSLAKALKPMPNLPSLANASEATPHSSGSGKSGQVQISDLVVSLAVFMMLLIIVYITWYRQVDISSGQLLDFRSSQAAERALISIINSPGFPSNWASQGLLPTSPSLLGIGAAESYGNIDPTKLAIMGQYFNSSDYGNSTRLKMGISPFEGDVKITYLNGTNISIMGAGPASSDIVLSSRQRVAAYQGKPVLVRVRIWQNESG